MEFTLDQTAKTLQLKRNEMTKALRDKGVFDSRNIPQGRFAGKGFFVVPQCSYRHPNNGITYYQKTLVTPKGVNLIETLLKTNNKPTIH